MSLDLKPQQPPPGLPLTFFGQVLSQQPSKAIANHAQNHAQQPRLAPGAGLVIGPTDPTTPSTRRPNPKMDFNHLGDWERLSYDELSALKKENFGFMGNTKLWNYSRERDLDLSTVDLSKGRSYVETRLNDLAIKFKRAVVVLRTQAVVRNRTEYGADPPKLLHTIIRNLELAGKMCRPFTVLGNRLLARQRADAILFLHTSVIVDENEDDDRDDEESDAATINAGLRANYGGNAVDELVSVWNGVYTYWLQQQD
jgi:hypothetical protein